MYHSKKPGCKRGYTIKNQPNFFNLHSERVQWISRNEFITDDKNQIVGLKGNTYDVGNNEAKRIKRAALNGN